MSEAQEKNDRIILRLLTEQRLRVDAKNGLVYSNTSNTPDKPIGSPTRKGYIRATVNVDGSVVGLLIHRVVWIASHGIPPRETPQINHIDTVKGNNRLSNLELQNNVGNMQHAAANDCLRVPRGERATKAKLKEAEVLEMRRLAQEGKSARELAKRFGIARQSAQAILNRESWAWLEETPVGGA